MTDFPIATTSMWSLGTFKPTGAMRAGNYNLVHEAFEEFMLSRVPRVVYKDESYWDRGLGGLVPGVNNFEVRHPSHAWSLRHLHGSRDTSLKWHKDQGNAAVYVVTWSNNVGTEIWDKRLGWTYQAEPWQVIAFDNRRLFHRSPVTTSDRVIENRWFARAFIKQRATVRDRKDLFALTLRK